DRVVVGDQYADHASTRARLIVNVVPDAPLATSRLPPTRASRSRIPLRPYPLVLALTSKPGPSSLTVRELPASVTVADEAPECFRTLERASWVHRNTTTSVVRSRS